MEMPILDRILSTPASTASKKWPWATGPVVVVVAVVGPVGQRLEGEAGTDRVGAVADERREEVGVPGVVGQGDHETHVAPTLPSSIRRWWAAPTASTDGMGARSASTAPSLDDQDLAPAAAVAASTSSARRSTPAWRPSGPSATGKWRRA